MTKKSQSIIKAFRSLKGVSQTQLADQLGCSQSKISQVEKGHVSLGKGDASKIAEILQVDASLLFGGSEDGE